MTATVTDLKAGLCVDCRGGSHALCMSVRCACPRKSHPNRSAPRAVGRSEMEMAADVLVALHRAGIGRIAQLLAATGVTRPEWLAAVERHERSGYRPPRGGAHVSLPTQALNARRYAKTHPTPDTRICSTCGQTKPLSEFYVVNRRTGNVRSDCKDCHLEKSRARYLLVGQVAVAVELVEGDGCLGHPCPRCGKPFAVGERVTGSDLTHEECA